MVVAVAALSLVVALHLAAVQEREIYSAAARPQLMAAEAVVALAQSAQQTARIMVVLVARAIPVQ